MGVPGFFLWLIKNIKKLGSKNMILKELEDDVDWLMLDTNCLLHPCIAYIIEKYKEGKLSIDVSRDLRVQLEEYIWIKITNCIDYMIEKLCPKYVYIAIDGVAPKGKILQQRQRRYKFLFDKKIKLNTNLDVFSMILSQHQSSNILNNQKDDVDDCMIKTKKLLNGIQEPIIPLSSIELTPGTDYMERINIKMNEYIKILGKRGINCIYSSYHEEGEGEHKILQYIKKNLTSKETIVIYGLDADLLFLSLSIGFDTNLYVMRETQVFTNKDVDFGEVQEYNYVQIKQLRKLISNLDISTDDFIILCYLIGNDFLPNILTLDVKKGGLDKIFRAWKSLKEKKGIETLYDKNGEIVSLILNKNLDKYEINWEILRGVFNELKWTEKYIWKNINRDKLLNQDTLEIEEKNDLEKFKQIEKKEQMDKFIEGSSSYTDFLDKIEFSSSIEYYSYYLGIECIDIDKSIIIKMVNEYINGINWCMLYYLDECRDWNWGYNFMVAPLICDILNFFPNSKNILNIVENRKLNPVEQLILAIPPQTYKYVLEKELVDKIKSNKFIGYMFPELFGVDVNKEQVYWKCPVKIPIVEMFDFDYHIKKININ